MRATPFSDTVLTKHFRSVARACETQCFTLTNVLEYMLAGIPPVIPCAVCLREEIYKILKFSIRFLLFQTECLISQIFLFSPQYKRRAQKFTPGNSPCMQAHTAHAFANHSDVDANAQAAPLGFVRQAFGKCTKVSTSPVQGRRIFWRGIFN